MPTLWGGDNVIRKALYMSERAVYLLRKKAYETQLTESELTRQAIDLYLGIEKVWPAVLKLAEVKKVKPPEVVEAALKRQIPDKYFE
jgi:hypothetical protein